MECVPGWLPAQNTTQFITNGIGLAFDLIGLKNGGCFVAGTIVHVANLPDQNDAVSRETSEADGQTELVEANGAHGRQFAAASGRSAVLEQAETLLVPIESVPLGARVTTQNPRPEDSDNTFEQPDESSWVRVTLEASKRNGITIDSELLRPRDWVEAQGLTVGSLMPMRNEELEIDGWARVIGISACPPLADGDGELITGRFVTRQVEQTVLMTYSNGERLEGTTVHPIWSPELEDWVPMSEFKVGDAVQTRDGWTEIQSIEFRYEPVRVYNLEVHGEHVYETSQFGILVHNAGPAYSDHHLMTNKNSISTAAGGPYTPKFQALATKRGITLDDAKNILRLAGHAGPHPEYNKAVYKYMTKMTSGLSGAGYNNAFDKALNYIRNQTPTVGTRLNRLATGG